MSKQSSSPEFGCKIRTDEELRVVIKRRTVKNPETGCWEWRGMKINGYGALTHKGKTVFAHRTSFRVFNGPLIAGKVIMHVCDNPPCCNPKHLRQGTRSENALDMYAKGRDAHIKRVLEAFRHMLKALG